MGKLAGIKKALDMSKQARMQRARDMGFDTDTTYYVSTLKDLEKFDRTGKFAGHTGVSGISVTDNPEMASRYLDRFASHGFVDGVPNQPFSKNIMPVYIKKGRSLEVDKSPYASPVPMGHPLPDGYVNPLTVDGFDSMAVPDAISRRGIVKHSNAKNAIRGNEVVLTDPSNIRSINAAFDPDKKDSANLLAGTAATAVGAGAMLGSDEAEASILGTAARALKPETLKLAEKMRNAGATRDEIWKATGEQFGQPAFFDDGHFKWEIDDSGVTLPGFDKTRKGTPIKHQMADLTWRQNRSSVPFDEIVNHEGLTDNYPQLRNIEYGSAVPSDSKGVYRPDVGDGYIGLNPDLDISQARSTNLHELQHAIQEREGFAGGGSSDSFEKELARKKYDAIQAIRGLNDQMRENVRIRDRLEAEGADKSRLKFYEDDYQRLIGHKAEFIADAGIDPIDIQAAAHKQYQRLYGEAEARAVQSRMDMPMQDRIEKPFWKSFDVPEDELIRRYESTAANLEGRKRVAAFKRHRRVKQNQFEGLKKAIFAGLARMDYAAQFLQGQQQFMHSLAEGDGLQQALSEGLSTGIAPLEESAYQRGAAVVDATGSPALGTAVNVLNQVASPI